ncbi:MAG: hypothetical protein M1415_05205, partial [Firmicutes bacterium]|nr:hypothetical protein [Bacillota bacterium]
NGGRDGTAPVPRHSPETLLSDGVQQSCLRILRPMVSWKNPRSMRFHWDRTPWDDTPSGIGFGMLYSINLDV